MAITVVEQLLCRAVIGYEVLLTIEHCLRRQVLEVVKKRSKWERKRGVWARERRETGEGKRRGQQQVKTSRGKARKWLN